jgi:hypothetical protein
LEAVLRKNTLRPLGVNCNHTRHLIVVIHTK